MKVNVICPVMRFCVIETGKPTLKMPKTAQRNFKGPGTSWTLAKDGFQGRWIHWLDGFHIMG